jgi:hypothetical protein
MAKLTILAEAPVGSTTKEITFDELAKRLGLPAADLEAQLEKNLTVGDVHVSTALTTISTAYLQGEEDDGDEDEETEKNDNHDERGRFASGSGGGGGDGAGAHLNNLMAAGTDRPKFEAAHTALSNDKSMKLGDLKAVAAGFRGGHVSSSKDTRSDILGAIRRSFTEHARFHEKIKSFDLDVRKLDPDQRKIFGWASVAAFDGVLVVDKQDDIIMIADLEKAAHEFTLYSRTQGDMHTDIGVGRMIESVVFDQAKRDAGIVAKDDQGRTIDGWWVGFLVDDDGVWDAHKRGERPEFSIGGRAQREPAP